jgi:hypothetical protein
MGRAGDETAESANDLSAEYAFDYSKANKNPYAARLKGTAVDAAVPRRSRARTTPRSRKNRKTT